MRNIIVRILMAIVAVVIIVFACCIIFHSVPEPQAPEPQAEEQKALPPAVPVKAPKNDNLVEDKSSAEDPLKEKRDQMLRDAGYDPDAGYSVSVQYGVK